MKVVIISKTMLTMQRWTFRLFLTSSLLIVTMGIQAQTSVTDLQTIIPPAPTAASLGKYAEWPVGLFTGVPSISIPLYELKGRSISVPVSVNYHASGIRVGEIASPVGLGWSLSAGGVITRSVRGIADENPNGGYFKFRQFFQDPQDISFVDSNFANINDLINQASKGTWDTQPDQFMFSAMGRSFTFFFNGGDTIVTQPYSNIRITADFADSIFTAILEDGTRLVFGGTGCTEMTNASNSFTIAGSNHFSSSWYLQKIISTTGEVIVFHYNSQTIVHNSNFTESDYLPYTETLNGILYNYNDPCPCGNPSFPTGSQLNFEYQTTNGCSLASIESDLGQIYFDKDSNARTDNPGDTAIIRMRVFSKTTNAFLKEFRFQYNYSNAAFSNSAGNLTLHPEEAYRLKLAGIGEYFPGTGIKVNQWKFDYNPVLLPLRGSFAQDHWGYYNGATSNQTLLPPETGFLVSDGYLSGNRAPDTAYSQAEMLTKITYPTGGASLFMFEQNSYPDSAEMVKDTSAALSYNLDSGTGDTTTQKSATFTLANTQNIELIISGFFTSAYLAYHPNCGLPYATLYKGGDTLIANIKVCHTGETTQSLVLQPGNYTLTLNRDLLTNPTDSNHSSVFARMLYQESLGIQPFTHLVGGVRVKSIVYSDSINTAANQTQVFQYENPYVIAPVDTVNDYITNIEENCSYVSPSGGGYSSQNCVSRAFARSSVSRFTLGSIQGGVIGYGKVTTLSGPNGENGQKVSFFSTTHDLASFNPRLYPYPPATSRDCDRGLPLASYSYSNTCKLVSSETDLYGPLTRDYITAIKIGINPVYTQSTTPGILNLGIISRPYDLVADQVKHTQSVQTLYSSTGLDSVTVTKNYFYDNPAFMQPTRSQEIKSNGDTLTAISSFPLDSITDLSVTAQQARDSMIARNIISPVLEKTVYNNSTLLSKTKNNYAVWWNNQVLPESIEFQTHQHPLEKRIQYGNYTAYGNLITQSKFQDVLHSYLWDYQHTYPIAETINADSGSIAYTSFEADGAGNWTIGSTSRDSSGITGTKSYILNSDIAKSGLNSSITYIVSYWTTNHSPFTITGTLSGYPIQGKTISYGKTGWTFYTHRVSGQTTITIGGTGRIDELRLYPLGAQMTTYTYAPLVGMTSHADIGSRITYYEYDGVQRLIRIRDQDHNILKTLEYQYQVSSGCGGNCYNIAMQNLAGTNTLGYPVGVFDVHGKLLGNATGQAQYVSLWNADTANARIGTLATGTDSLHFSLSLNTGMTLPAAVTGCRYFQVDLTWNRLDAVRNFNGAYIDFGDGTGMRMGKGYADTPAIIAPNTTYATIFDGGFQSNENYYVHTYTDSSLKTLTFYHNDASESEDFDNLMGGPTTGLTYLSNLRGNLPQNTITIGGSSYQSAGMTNLAGVLDWNAINTIQYFRLNKGDGVNPVRNVSYPQDFLKNDKGLISIFTSEGFYHNGYRDTTFKLSRLKSDWNTYFTNLQYLQINDEHWNREDLTALTHLNFIQIFATTQDHQDDHSSSLVSIPQSAIDNLLIQVASGAGQTVLNGLIDIESAGVNRTSASDTAVAFLKSKGWIVAVNGIVL